MNLWSHSSGLQESEFGLLELSAPGVGPGQVEQDLDVVKLEELLQAVFVHLNGGNVLKKMTMF